MRGQLSSSFTQIYSPIGAIRMGIERFEEISIALEVGCGLASNMTQSR